LSADWLYPVEAVENPAVKFILYNVKKDVKNRERKERYVLSILCVCALDVLDLFI
jgi:hypothetical protein